MLVLALAQAVGGSEGRPSRVCICSLCRVSDDTVSLTERDRGCTLEAGRVELSEPADVRRESTIEETRFVNGDGESSSSLSLQPRPVVRPIPPRSKVPSRCLTRLLTVSR